VNARDAMPNGGRLAIETAVVDVDERFHQTDPWGRPGRYVRVGVSDTGGGIPPAAPRPVFEPVFTTQAHGSCHGHAPAAGITRRPGGVMQVCSDVGRGTTFKTYLPVSEQHAAPRSGEGERVVKGGSETILVAEDEPRVRAVVVRILERAGYRVLTAEDGELA